MASRKKILKRGAVAEWSKAHCSRDKLNEKKPQDPRFIPKPDQSLKNPNKVSPNIRVVLTDR